MAPPAPVSPSPTFNVMSPPLPPTALPVLIEMLPLAPAVWESPVASSILPLLPVVPPAPVFMDTSPLLPDVPPAAVDSVIAPLSVAVPTPVVIVTAPPAPAPAPAVSEIAPPTADAQWSCQPSATWRRQAGVAIAHLQRDVAAVAANALPVLIEMLPPHQRVRESPVASSIAIAMDTFMCHLQLRRQRHRAAFVRCQHLS